MEGAIDLLKSLNIYDSGQGILAVIFDGLRIIFNILTERQRKIGLKIPFSLL